MEMSTSEGRLCISVVANTVRLPPTTLEDFDLPPLVLRRFCSDPHFVLHPSSTGSAVWCHVLPSMKKGQIINITRQLPRDGPFRTYRDLQNHWNRLYGYRLPELAEEQAVYCSVYFKLVGQRLFTYPLSCVRLQPVQRGARVDLQGALGSFLADIRDRLHSVCGFPARLTGKPRYPTASLSTAAAVQVMSGDQINLTTSSSVRPVLTALPPPPAPRPVKPYFGLQPPAQTPLPQRDGPQGILGNGCGFGGRLTQRQGCRGDGDRPASSLSSSSSSQPIFQPASSHSSSSSSSSLFQPASSLSSSSSLTQPASSLSSTSSVFQPASSLSSSSSLTQPASSLSSSSSLTQPASSLSSSSSLTQPASSLSSSSSLTQPASSLSSSSSLTQPASSFSSSSSLTQPASPLSSSSSQPIFQPASSLSSSSSSSSLFHPAPSLSYSSSLFQPASSLSSSSSSSSFFQPVSSLTSSVLRPLPPPSQPPLIPALKLVPIFRNKCPSRHINIAQLRAQKQREQLSERGEERGRMTLPAVMKKTPNTTTTAASSFSSSVPVLSAASLIVPRFNRRPKPQGSAAPQPAPRPSINHVLSLSPASHSKPGVILTPKPAIKIKQKPKPSVKLSSESNAAAANAGNVQPSAAPPGPPAPLKSPEIYNKNASNSCSKDGVVFESKPKKSKSVVRNVDVEQMARSNQLSKVNSATLLAWLRGRGVYVSAKHRKEELMLKVMGCLAEA